MSLSLSQVTIQPFQNNMADETLDKKLKLANTKKRFKELQELKKKRNERQNLQSTPTNETTDVDSVETSSRNTPVEAIIVKKQEFNDDSACKTEAIYTKPQEVRSVRSFFFDKSLVEEDFDTEERGNTITSDVNNQKKGLNISNQVNSKENSTSENLNSSNLPNYFTLPNTQSPTEFFDNVSPQNEDDEERNSDSPTSITHFNTSEITEQNSAENIGLPRYFDNINSSSTIWENTVPENRDRFKDDYTLFPNLVENNYKNLDKKNIPNDDALSLDDPEIKQNEIKEYASKRPDNLVTHPSPESDPFCVEKTLENIFSPIETQQLLECLDTTGATETEKMDVYDTVQQIDSSTDLTKKEILYSNSESLKQLSDQLANMIESDYEYSSPGTILDLEKRTLELTAKLEQEKINSDQLQAANIGLQARITELEADLAQRELGSGVQYAQELVYLKSELQTHLQTIGLLVAEKTELSSNLSQYEISFKQKNAECEELQARLKASRSRVADLERELNNLKSEKSKTEVIGEQYSVTLDSLRQEYQVLKEQRDDLAQELLEVREKMKNILDETLKLQEENKNLSGKLSLADIKIQQLTSGGTLGIDSRLEQLAQEKMSLEGEIANLNQMLKSIIRERDESTVQFQQYAQQLNAQITNMSSKLEEYQRERENMLSQEQNRIKHIGELERQLQNIQNDQVSYGTRISGNSELKNELENTKEMCVQLQIEKTSAEEKYTKISNEKELLLKELAAKTDSISQLETMIEQLKGNQPDSVRLLATMESDKVAASRAIQQNKELKQQLESMQEVFMKMDNDKVELTENLKAQLLTNKELLEKLQKTELILQSLADAIEIKDKELTNLRESSDEMSRKALQHEQLEDRLRHYEAHDNSANSLQQELQEAKQTIIKLTNEINRKNEVESKENSREDSVVENELQAAKRKIIELSNEINKLMIRNGEEAKSETTAESQVHSETLSKEQAKEIENDIYQRVVNVELDIDRKKNYIDKENATKYLEEKVKRTMQEIADLTEEKQRLEHIVLQLQGETETIGEYVALYQHQRMVLKQKALEKDQQLRQLADDRQQIKLKLDRLNQLIKKLVTEKGALPAELIEHHESMNNQINNFCEEHSKMNDEISKITQNQTNIIEPDNDKENKQTSQTAEEIITLLTEIKTSNLVEPNDNFHHCPWCSGQLINV